MSENLRAKWNQMKPAKPKKPATNFAFFVSEFKSKSKRLEPKELFPSASQAWNRLNGNEKRKYENAKALEEYNKKMREYKTKSSAMRVPPGAYALFVQEWWKDHKPKMPRRKNARRREFGKVSVRISKAWKAKTKAQRATYIEKAALLNKIFERELDQVVAKKRPLNLNWRDEAIEEANGKRRRLSEDCQSKAGSQKEDDEEYTSLD